MRVPLHTILFLFLGPVLFSLGLGIYLYGGSTEIVLSGDVMRHPNGLSVRVPAGCKVRQIEGRGFEICTGRRSSPLVITVEDTVSTDIASMKKRKLSAGRAYYRTSFAEGAGSGGDEYSISALQQVGDRWIVMRRMKQSEWGHPGFEMEWAVFGSARISE